MKEELKLPEIHVRQLTVSHLFQSDRFYVPFIRLCGKWLEDAGFTISSSINVIVKEDELVIKKKRR